MFKPLYTGLLLRASLVAVEAWLIQQGVKPDESARDAYACYLSHCDQTINGAPFDMATAWKRFDGAVAKNPKPATPEEKLIERLEFHTRKVSSTTNTKVVPIRSKQQAKSRGLALQPTTTNALEECCEDTPLEGGLNGLLSTIPSGWHMAGDKIVQTSIDAGRLACLIETHAPGLTRFNDLFRWVEFNAEPIKEDEAAVFYVRIQEIGYRISDKQTIDATLRVAYEQRFHPVRAYLDTVANAVDTKSADISNLATKYLGTSDPLYDAMLRKTLIGAVARIYEPGCQFDSVCVLRGKQGIRKSTFWKMLASPAWFNCTAPDSDKDLILNVHGCWLFELAELESITSKREVGQLRNLITTQVDLFRVPYGKATAHHKRRSIFVGSVNGETFLKDDEGSRRFWVIECPQVFDRGELIDVERVRRDRDAIWKAAVIAYRNGEKPFLDHADQVASSRRNGAYEQEHPWTAQLDAWALRRGSQPFTTPEALIGSGCRIDGSVGKKEEMEGATVLRKLGFKRQCNQTHGPGGRARRWFRLTQPTQPDSTSNREVESGQTPVTVVDRGGLTQPTQPFSVQSCCFEVGGDGEGSERESQGFPRQVETVESEGVNPLQGNRSTPTQPPPTDVESESAKCPDRYSPAAWHPRARALAAKHPDWHPHQIAHHLGPGFAHIDGRAVKALLGGRP
jgi:hypothetical protein